MLQPERGMQSSWQDVPMHQNTAATEPSLVNEVNALWEELDQVLVGVVTSLDTQISFVLSTDNVSSYTFG